jgi:competence protein ComEC
VRVVLTGDIGAAVEAEVAQLIAALEQDEPPATLTVLKVAHHGSAGASTAPLLALLRPSVAILSSGAANPFGHPAPATLARLHDAGADVWRTDRDGEVSVSTNGAAIEVRGHTGRRRSVAAQPR